LNKRKKEEQKKLDKPAGIFGDLSN